MHDLGRHRRALDAVGRRADARSASSGEAQAAEAAERLQLPADLATAMSASTSRPIPNAIGTLKEAIGKIGALPAKPAFMIHTGDITHLSKHERIRRRRRSHRRSRSSTCITCRASTTSSTRSRASSISIATASGTKGTGWYSFDAGGVHFVGLVNVVNLKAGGMGNLGDEQLAWLEDDLKAQAGLDADRRLRAHSALDRLAGMGLGHRGRRARARAAASASARSPCSTATSIR